MRRAAAEEHLERYAAARDDALTRITGATGADPDVLGLWQVGSFGRGAGDAWSDLDLVVVPTDRTLASVVADPHLVLGLGDEPQFTMRSAGNGPSGGIQAGLCYLAADLPLWVDCYVWPRRTARVPSDGHVLVQRTDDPIATTDDGFSALLDRHRAAPDDRTPSDQERQAFRVLAACVACKKLARGEEPGLRGILQWVDVPVYDAAEPATVFAGLRQLLATVTSPDLRPAVLATEHLLDVGEALTRPPRNGRPASMAP